MHRLQVYIPEDLLNELRVLAQEEGVSVAEILRRSGRVYSKSKPKKSKENKYGPLFKMRGVIKGEPSMSQTVDEIYEDKND